MRRTAFRHRVALAVVACVLSLSAGARPARGQQDPAALRAQLARLEARERTLLGERDFWQRIVDDREHVFFWNRHTAQENGFPLFMRRAEAQELLERLVVTSVVTGQPYDNGRTAAQTMFNLLQFSESVKNGIRQSMIPDLERQIAAARDEQLRLRALLQAPPPLPRVAAGGWELIETMLGNTVEQMPAGTSVAPGSIGPSGGSIQMTFKVGWFCSETYTMTWRFGQSIERLLAGQVVPVQLRTQLTGGSCNNAQGAYLSRGDAPTEPFILARHNTQRELEGAFGWSIARAEANGTTHRDVTTEGTFRVERNPGRPTSKAVLRLYGYVPGYFHVIAYVFQAADHP